MMKKVNVRQVGHAYERQIRKEFIELGWEDCLTSRYASREKDDQLVDLVNTYPFQIQAKRWKSAPSYHKILNDMPQGGQYNIIMHKRPNKGEVVVMSKDDFYEILNMLIREKIIRP